MRTLDKKDGRKNTDFSGINPRTAI